MNTPKPPPFFTAPWPAVALSGVILVLFFIQSNFDTTGNILIPAFGLNPAALTQDTAYTLVSTLFVHGGWMHALLNAGFCLAFASGVSRPFGVKAYGVILFFTYYILCGVLAGWAYCLLFPDRNLYLIGASGAISGLMGSAIRLSDRGLLPFNAPMVFGLTVVWVGINLLSAFINLSPGEGPVAWEVHILGYFIGLLSIGVWMRIFKPSYFRR
jgi:membrane associated rhomboid family serine protease